MAKFEPLEHISESDFRYEVCLSDKGKDGKYRTIFTTSSIECRLTDLRPCSEYHIRIHALADAHQLRGGASDTVSFVTKSCEPDKPAPAKLVNRTKTSISLRWNAPSDNGKHILHYILEYDEGRLIPRKIRQKLHQKISSKNSSKKFVKKFIKKFIKNVFTIGIHTSKKLKKAQQKQSNTV
jgi:hypothetical protein